MSPLATGEYSPVATGDISEMAPKSATIVRNGIRKAFLRHGDLHPARNFVPNPMATLPEPRNPSFFDEKGRSGLAFTINVSLFQ